jgi:hypothetical protein
MCETKLKSCPREPVESYKNKFERAFFQKTKRLYIRELKSERNYRFENDGVHSSLLDKTMLPTHDNIDNLYRFQCLEPKLINKEPNVTMSVQNIRNQKNMFQKL